MTFWWFRQDPLLRKGLQNCSWYRFEICYSQKHSLVYNGSTVSKNACIKWTFLIKKTTFEFLFGTNLVLPIIITTQNCQRWHCLEVMRVVCTVEDISCWTLSVFVGLTSGSNCHKKLSINWKRQSTQVFSDLCRRLRNAKSN